MVEHPPFERLATPRLWLRRLAEADLEALVAYRADPAVARYQGWEGYTPAAGRALIEEMADLQPGTPGAWFQFGVALRPSDELIGDLGLHILADEPRCGEMGYTLAPAYQGRGLASEAVGALLTYAFGPLGLHRVTGSLLAVNGRSVALLERLGLRREAHFRRSTWFEGAWHDEYLYAALADEWSPG